MKRVKVKANFLLLKVTYKEIIVFIRNNKKKDRSQVKTAGMMNKVFNFPIQCEGIDRKSVV